jgi:hypothetical protein
MRGTRHGDWVVRNPSDLFLYPLGYTDRLRIEGMPQALD